jgi:hypothetical protein
VTASPGFSLELRPGFLSPAFTLLDLLEKVMNTRKIIGGLRRRKDKAQLMADETGHVLAAAGDIGPRETPPRRRAVRKIV